MPPAVIDPTAFAEPPAVVAASENTPMGSMPAATVDVADIGGMTDDDPGSLGGDSDTGPSGESAGGAGGSEGSEGESGGGYSGDSDGGDGGDGYQKGGEIRGNKQESRGVDKKVIRVTPGEFVIPKDTVQILGEDFFEELIAMTHTPVGRR